MTDREIRRRRHRRRRKRIRPGRASSLIYIDFEGRIDRPPVLLGVLYAPDPAAGDWQVTQFVLDERCAAVDAGAGADSIPGLPAEASTWLLDLSDREERQIVSWSEHDRDLIREFTPGRGFRWRNAIATARALRPADEEAPSPNSLGHYEALVGYERPDERHGVGDSIAYIHERSSVPPGSVDRWLGILAHNRHDLIGMRAVVERALGLG